MRNSLSHIQQTQSIETAEHSVKSTNDRNISIFRKAINLIKSRKSMSMWTIALESTAEIAVTELKSVDGTQSTRKISCDFEESFTNKDSSVVEAINNREYDLIIGKGYLPKRFVARAQFEAASMLIEKVAISGEDLGEDAYFDASTKDHICVGKFFLII
jgi:hypothetical protein